LLRERLQLERWSEMDGSDDMSAEWMARAIELRWLIAAFAEQEEDAGRLANAIYLWAMLDSDPIASIPYDDFAIVLYERTRVKMSAHAIKRARSKMIGRLWDYLAKEGFGSQ
jgi:hypothetical protein